MKIYVMVDIEGISGIYCREQIIPTEYKFNEGRRLFTEEINACVEGLREAGVDEIIVHDCHGGGYSLEIDKATPKADGYIVGNVGDTRFVDIKGCDGLVLLGYHAMAGTEAAILEHTYSSSEVQNMYLNDKRVGEIAVDAAIAGEQGVPVIMVSGDDKTCKEARAILPNVVTAEVKKGLSSFGGVLMPVDKAHALIKSKAIEAVKNLGKVKAYKISGEITCRLELVERRNLPSPSAKPYMKVIDGRTFEVTANSVEEALWRAFK